MKRVRYLILYIVYALLVKVIRLLAWLCGVDREDMRAVVTFAFIALLCIGVLIVGEVWWDWEVWNSMKEKIDGV